MLATIGCPSASELDSPLKDVWLVDSGTQRHICNRETRIRKLTKAPTDDAVMAGSVPLKIIGYCEALVRLPRPDGSIRNVWLSNTAFVRSSTANLMSTGMLHDHGIFLSERTSAFEDSSGNLVYHLRSQNRLWIAEEMSSALEMDWVHLSRWYEKRLKPNYHLLHLNEGHKRAIVSCGTDDSAMRVKRRLIVLKMPRVARFMMTIRTLSLFVLAVRHQSPENLFLDVQEMRGKKHRCCLSRLQFSTVTLRARRLRHMTRRPSMRTISVKLPRYTEAKGFGRRQTGRGRSLIGQCLLRNSTRELRLCDS